MKPTLRPLFWWMLGSAFVAMIAIKTEQHLRPSTGCCNPRLAHCEVHGGPEIIIEIEKPKDPEPVIISPESGETCLNFDAMA